MRRVGLSGRDGSSRRVTFPALGLVAVLTAVLVLALVATPVAAHAYLSESDPANGEQVESVPDEVTLSFSGDGVQVADVDVIGPDGELVSGEAVIDPEDTQHVSVPTEDAGDGMYTVEWEVLADDGHTTSGTFFFSVGDEPLDRDAVLDAYDDDDDDDISVIEAGANGLLLVSLVGLVGIPVATWAAIYPVLARNQIATAPIDRRLQRILAAVTVLLFVSAFALGATRAASTGQLSLTTVFEFLATPLGAAWLVQLVVGAIVLGVLVAAIQGRGSRRLWTGVPFVGALVVAGTVGWTSHSATAVDRLQGTAIDFAHVAGGGFWFGGLLVVAAVGPLLLRRADADCRAAVAADLVRRYSIVALTGVTLAVMTGLLLAAWHAPTIGGLVDTLYGTALSAKVLLVAVALGLGGYVRFVLLRRLDADSDGATIDADSDSVTRNDGATIDAFTHTVRLEIAVLVVVLLLSGLITAAPTAAMAGHDHELGEAAIDRDVGDVTVELAVLPAELAWETIYVNENDPTVYEVTFTDGNDRLQAEGEVRILAVNERHETTLELDLEETDDGSYAVVQPLPDPEHWEFRITGMVEGTYVDEWFEGYAIPDDHDHGDHDETGADTAFAMWLRFGALGIGVIGSLAIVHQIRAFGRKAP